MLLALLVISCDPPKSSDDQSRGETRQFIAANLPRSEEIQTKNNFKPDYYRSNFVTFTLRAGIAPEGDYRIGAKIATANAPTATQLIDSTAAITRTLSSTDINIYLPFHIDGDFFNTGVTKNYSNAQGTILTKGTEYSIYLTKTDGSGSVEKIIDITTDELPTVTEAGNTYNFPGNISIKADDPFFIIAGFPNYAGSMTIEDTTTNISLALSTFGAFTTNPADSRFTFLTNPTDDVPIFIFVEQYNLGELILKVSTGSESKSVTIKVIP